MGGGLGSRAIRNLVIDARAVPSAHACRTRPVWRHPHPPDPQGEKPKVEASTTVIPKPVRLLGVIFWHHRVKVGPGASNNLRRPACIPAGLVGLAGGGKLRRVLRVTVRTRKRE